MTDITISFALPAVGSTIFDCIPDPSAPQRWTLGTNDNDLVGSSDLATKHAWARAVALSAICSSNSGAKIGI